MIRGIGIKKFEPRWKSDMQRIGSKNGISKLNEKKVRRIRSIYRSTNFSQRKLARQFRVSHILIGKIIRKELWTHV